MKNIRLRADKLFRGLIKLCTLTGVTFLVTACYGVRHDYMPEDEKAEIEEIEKKLADSITVDKNDLQR